jgi:hypothetical protein
MIRMGDDVAEFSELRFSDYTRWGDSRAAQLVHIGIAGTGVAWVPGPRPGIAQPCGCTSKYHAAAIKETLSILMKAFQNFKKPAAFMRPIRAAGRCFR